MSAAIGQLEAINPDAVKLAEAVAFAVMIDRALLRAARIELVPQADAGAEADLWFSALVQSRTGDGIVLDPAIAEELRARMLPARVEEVWAVTDREHKELAPSLRIEEEIAYFSVSKKPSSSEQLAWRLRSVLAAMVSGDRAGIARWAARALAMFPSAVRDLPEAKMLDTGVRMRLGETIDVAPDAALPEWMPWVAPASLGNVPLSIELREDELEIRTDPSTTPQLEIPNTNPLVLEVSWEQQTKQITFRRGEVVTVPVGRGELGIRTITGQEYVLREVGFVPDRFRERILDFSEEIARHPELIGRARELEQLRSMIPRERYIAVVGPLGIGKTAFLTHAIRAFSSEMPVFTHFFREGNYRLDRMAAADRSLVAQIALRFGLSDRVLDLSLGDVLQLLAFHPNRPERMLIVMDDLDVARDEMRRAISWEWLELPGFVTVVASSSRELPSFASLALERTDRTTLVQFLESRRALQSVLMSAELSSIAERANGNFGDAEILAEGAALTSEGDARAVVERWIAQFNEEARVDIGIIAVRKEPVELARAAAIIRADPISTMLLRRQTRIDAARLSFINERARSLVLASRQIDFFECHREIVRRVESAPAFVDYYLLYGPTHVNEGG